MGATPPPHTGDDSIFFTGYTDGERSATHHGLYAASAARVTVPLSSWKSNDTIVIYATTRVAGGELSLDFGQPADAAARFLAASEAVLHMGGGFWTLKDQDVLQTVITPDGRSQTTHVFGEPVSGQMNVTSPPLAIGSSLVYVKLPRAVARTE